MPPESPTPYSTPETEECLSESGIAQVKRSPLPPLKLWRLGIAIVLVTGILVAIWALVHYQQLYCIIVATMCGMEISRMLDPHNLRFGSNLIHSFLWKLAGSGVFIAFFTVWMLWRELPVVSSVLQHPVSYGVVWSICCGLMIMDWWNRRNNPPYQPAPDVDSVAFSRWKRMRRLGIRK